jgi:hypothetical protein
MTPLTQTQTLLLGVILVLSVFVVTFHVLLNQPTYVGVDELASTAARTPVPALTPAPTPPPPLVLFLVMPSLLPPEDFATQFARAQAVQKTWASLLPARRVFFVQWFATHRRVIDNSQQLLVVPSGPHNATYASRVLWAVQQLVERHDPAFIVKGDDVTYFLTSNVLRFLSGRDPDEHLFVGHLLQGPTMPRPFVSAGAGYILSRSVLKVLVQAVRDNHTCIAGEWGFEDLTLARCLDELLSLRASAALDEENRDMFHAFSPLTLLDLGGIYRFPVEWYESYRKNFGGVVTGPDCCSRRSMSFHYLVPREMLAFHSSLMSRTVDEQQFAQMVPESGFELLRFFLEHLEINA